MTRAVTIRRTTLGLLAAGATCAMLGLPSAGADPADPSATPPRARGRHPGRHARRDARNGRCNAAGLAKTISSVTAELNVYFAAHPDVNQALIDAARQPAFVAVGQFDDYFKEHPTRPTRCAASRHRWVPTRTGADCRWRPPTPWPSSRRSRNPAVAP
jgi:hemophore-related protein